MKTRMRQLAIGLVCLAFLASGGYSQVPPRGESPGPCLPRR
jgi:hypothetical protein